MLFGAAAGGIFAISMAMEKKRREALAQYAQMHGLAFDAEGAEPEREFGSVFPIFQIGRNQTFRYALKGTRGGASFTAFEFKYVTGGGKNSHTNYLAFMSWSQPDAGLPKFYVGPEGWWDKLKQRFGAQDFDFAEDPGFSDLYVLQGGDEPAVRKLFDGSKRAFLVAHPDSHAAGTGPTLLWWRDQRLPVADDLETFFADGDAFRRIFFQ